MADMAWGVSDWLSLFIMWAVMMVAMMLPSAAPVILLVLGVYRRREDPRARVAAVLFVLGYVLAWTAFSAAASALQIVLHRAALMAADMRLSSSGMSAAILIAAGVYQWLPIKSLCLTSCQSPLGFLSRHWREGAWGGLTMGVRHGITCVGCCWLIMALLFAVGVMNLLWVAALTALVLVEKLFPRGAAFGRMAGVVMAGWGIVAVMRSVHL
jgi:predicted metal-binding membrane protein